MIPADLVERLTNALAHWDGRGSTPDDDFQAGKEMASAIMALLVWDANKPVTDSAAGVQGGLMEVQWEKLGGSVRFAELDGGRVLIDRMTAQEMTLRFVDGPVIATACHVNRRWVVYPDGGSHEMFARRLDFERKADAVQYLVELRELDTTSPEARFCEIACHNWTHTGGVREGDIFVQRQLCAHCSAERQLRFNLVNGELLSEEPSDR